MSNFTKEELTEALRAVNSIIGKCENAQKTMEQKACAPQQALLRNRLKAMYISKELITEAMEAVEKTVQQGIFAIDNTV